jgi:hypothetical protein
MKKPSSAKRPGTLTPGEIFDQITPVERAVARATREASGKQPKKAERHMRSRRRAA